MRALTAYRPSRRAAIAAAALLAALVALSGPVGEALGDQASSRRGGLLDGRIGVKESQSCAINAGGDLYCWGAGGYLGYMESERIGDDEPPVSAGPVFLGLNAKAVALAKGRLHTCALLDNGTVKCWGAGAHGRLGYGNTNTIGDDELPGSQPPIDLGAGRTAIDISAGDSHTCALLDNGTVRCWGGNAYALGYGNTGDIGDNETPGSVGPVSIGAGRTAVAITTGILHTCVILDTGQVRCWGHDGYGQLGIPGTQPIGDNELPSSVAPVDLGAGRTAVAITAAERHTCAILDNGGVKCWGGPEYGRLGYGNMNNVPEPAAVGTVDLGAGRTAVAITAGTNHTCAILDNGDTRCWGLNEWALLGGGETPIWGAGWIGDDETPGSIPPLFLGTDRHAVDISAGNIHTCAMLDDGTIRCWGAGNDGQLGNEIGTEPFPSYGTFIGDDERPGDLDPVDLGGRDGALQVAAGAAHTCAVFGEGTVRCWGKGADGRLGYGSTETIGDNESPGAAGTVDLNGSAVEVAVGDAHSCALMSDGQVRCWGKGADGRLGYAHTNTIGDDETPGSISSVPIAHQAVAISAGGAHTCALLNTGQVRCWGLNASGQLGYGHTNRIGDNETPFSAGSALLAAGRNAIEVTAGENHTCAVLDDHSLRCWGLGTLGRLGYGNTTTIGDDEAAGTGGAVSLGRTASSAASGASHSCSVLSDGTMRCWGNGLNGRLGYSNTVTIGDNELPSSVGTVAIGRSTTQTAAGGSHTCARLDTGQVRCWGLGANGRLGYGNTVTIGDNELPTAGGPVSLGGSHTAQGLSAGGAHTCVVIDDGTVRCWGLNSDGQLGYGNTKDVGDDETPGSVPVVDFVDDPPVAVNDLAFAIEDGPATTIEVLANDNDPDGGPMQIVAAGPAANGTVLIAGDGKSLSFEPDPDFCGLQSFPYTLNGGSTATVTVLMTCVDDPPVAVDDQATLNEDGGATTIDVLANDTDIDAGPRSIATKTNGAHGTVALAGDNLSLTYEPDPNYCGADSFTYTLAPGGATATVSVTVTCVDDLPVAVDDPRTILEDAGEVEIDVLANDTDADGGDIEIDAISTPQHGTVEAAADGLSLSYAPDPDYCGPDSFTYTLAPGGATATVSVTVTCVDDPPVAVDDEATVNEDAGATAIDVLDNDTDIDAGPKLIESVGTAAHGAVVRLGGGVGLTYQPDPNYCGPDSFTYALVGGSTATVSVDVTCIDDPPVAVNDSATTAEEAEALEIDVLDNDTDVDGGAKEIASAGAAQHGTVVVAGDDLSLSYEPDPNYCGPDSFTYALAPGGSIATVSVTVTCFDDPPLAVDDGATVAEDSAATTIDVLDNDSDADGGPKSVESVGSAQHGTVARLGAGFAVSYAPDPNYCGPDSFTYTLVGGSTATVSVTVTCVDDPPQAVDDSATVAEDSGATAIDVIANDTDVDGGPRAIASRANGSHGAVAIAGDQLSLSYAPDPNYCGPDSFTYTLVGGSTATVSVTVTCVDDPPAAADDARTVLEDAGSVEINVLANDTDPDGGPREIASRTNASHGAVAIAGDGLSLTYTPDADYCGPDSFAYTVAPGGSTATVSVTVTCVDDPPLAVNDSATLAEDAAPTSVDVLANDTDVDGGPKAISARTNGSHGTVAIAADQLSLSYAPDPNYCGADSFTYTLGGGSTATVSVTVACVDDPPSAVDDSVTVLQGSSANPIDVLANDADVDGGAKSVTARTQAAHGAVGVIGGGAGLLYTPEAGYCGPDSFTYTLNGGSTATVTVAVTCVETPQAPTPSTGNEPAQPTPQPSTTIVQNGPGGPVVNVTPGVGVVSGRRKPRIAIKGIYAFFTLTCKLKDSDCAGKVLLSATIPSLQLGKTRLVRLVNGRFRIGASRSVLVRARLTAKGLETLEERRNLRGVGAKMRIVDSLNGERGEIVVNLVRRPKASVLGK